MRNKEAANSNHFEIAFKGRALIMIRAPRGLLGQDFLIAPQSKQRNFLTDQPLSVKKFKSPAGTLISKYFRALSLLLTVHRRISRCRTSRCRIVVHVCLVSLLPVFQLCCLPGSQADLQIGSRFWPRRQQPSSTARPVVLLWQGFAPSCGALTSLLS